LEVFGGGRGFWGLWDVVSALGAGGVGARRGLLGSGAARQGLSGPSSLAPDCGRPRVPMCVHAHVPCMRTHTRKHTQTHTLIHIRTHTHTLTHIRTHTNPTRARAAAGTSRSAHAHNHTHYAHTRSHSNARATPQGLQGAGREGRRQARPRRRPRARVCHGAQPALVGVWGLFCGALLNGGRRTGAGCGFLADSKGRGPAGRASLRWRPTCTGGAPRGCRIGALLNGGRSVGAGGAREFVMAPHLHWWGPGGSESTGTGAAEARARRFGAAGMTEPGRGQGAFRLPSKPAKEGGRFRANGFQPRPGPRRGASHHHNETPAADHPPPKKARRHVYVRPGDRPAPHRQQTSRRDSKPSARRPGPPNPQKARHQVHGRPRYRPVTSR
jgi:hypothetical protein